MNQNSTPVTPIPIVFATDDNYSQHLAATIASLFESNKDEAFDLYIILINVAQEHQNRLRELVDNRPDATLTLFEFEPRNYSHFPTNKHISWASYSRLFIPDLLRPEITKVVYLDSDLYIAGSIRPLWETDLGNHAVAGVANPVSRRQAPLGMPAEQPYINAGIILMNLEVWRTESLTRKMVEYITANASKLLYHDQDALNGFLYSRILCLDLRWNVHHAIFEESTQALKLSPEAHAALKTEPGIVHFTSDRKPWYALNRHPYRKHYWKSLRATPYRDCKVPPPTLGAINKAFPSKFRPSVVLRRIADVFAPVK